MLTRRTRLLVVDDHQSFGDLLSLALDGEDDLEVIGHAANGAAAIELVASTRPDIVLMDVRLPDGDGLELTARLTRADPDLRVVILTAHANVALLSRAGAAGACGFMSKTGPLAEMLTVLRSARSGQLSVPPELFSALAEAEKPHNRRAADRVIAAASLTQREIQVLEGLGRGYDPRAIASEMHISLHTCRGHVKSVLCKMNVHSALEAVVTATRAGLIRVGP